MSVQCPKGYSPDPDNSLPSKPDNSCTPDLKKKTYVRLKYEYEQALGMANVALGCGQSGTFTLNYGTNTEGSVSVYAVFVEGSATAGDVAQTSISVSLVSTDYEYIGVPVVLKETREVGTITTSGGFSKGGFWAKVKFAWNYMFKGAGALLPTLTYNDPDEVTESYIMAAWLICRKPCG